MRIFRPKRRRRQQGFSLIELSVVMAIVSIVAVLGLESMAMFMNRAAYRTTQERMEAIKVAIAKHRFVYGYIPCPGASNYSYSNVPTLFGKEGKAGVNCSGASLTSGGITLRYGDVPVRDLGLPMSYIRDGYGSKFRYVVSPYLAAPGVAANQFGNVGTQGLIEIRTGKIEQPCTTNCQVMTASAAYVLLSFGADKRGTTTINCAPDTRTDGMIDSVNCRFGNGQTIRNPSGTAVTIPDIVFYDSRYNAGGVEENHFDDLILWQVKNQL